MHRLLQEGEGHRLTGFLQASPMRAGDPHPPTHTYTPPTPPLYTQSWPSYILPLERQHHLLPAPSTRIRLDFFFPPSSSCCNAYLKEQQGARRCWIHILEAVEVVGKQGGGGGRGGGQDFYCTAKQLHCGGLLIRRTTQPGEDVSYRRVVQKHFIFI